MTTNKQDQKKRGADRRLGRARIEFPFTSSSGETIYEDRRQGIDPRRNAFISSIELCRGLPYEAIEKIIEHCPVKSLEQGERLIEQGEQNDKLYLVLSGSFRVHLSSLDYELGYKLDAGECIGEMSIIDGEPTSANVTAFERSEVIVIASDLFWHTIAPIPGAARNLLGVLTERIRKRNDDTLKALERELRLAQLQKELDAAKGIQRGMLPVEMPLFSGNPQIDVCAHMNAAWEVGGDFYDAFRPDERHACFVVGDVSGKGLPAALFMAQSMTLLKACLMHKTSLAAALGLWNQGLCERNAGHLFVSLFIAIVDLESGVMRYANAGHNPPLVRREERWQTLSLPDGLIAGVQEDAEYEEHSMQLSAGDALVAFTDGINEARDANKGFYGDDRLIAILQTLDDNDSTARVTAVLEDVADFVGSEPQSDDMTLLAFRYLGK